MNKFFLHSIRDSQKGYVSDPWIFLRELAQNSRDSGAMEIRIDSGGSGTTEHGIQTLLYAADNGARIVSCSWGGSDGSPSDALEDAIDYAYSKGTLTIAAAGNSSANTDSQT